MPRRIYVWYLLVLPCHGVIAQYRPKGYLGIDVPEICLNWSRRIRLGNATGAARQSVPGLETWRVYFR